MPACSYGREAAARSIFAAKSRSLALFQAPAVQEWLARDPNFLSKPVRQDAAVVFIDLSGFTALSERTDPDALRDLLKAFHALIDKAAVDCGGMVTGFLGDGAMLLFGLPHAMPDDAARALKCSIDLHRGVERWIASLPPAIGGQLGFKIGAHFGPIVASRLGESHQHITATGDTVNVASRLMEVAAQNDARLALTDTLLDAADFHGTPNGVLTGPLLTQVRGRSRRRDRLVLARPAQAQPGHRQGRDDRLNSHRYPPNTSPGRR
ncbi:hypothetical protein BRDID11002_29290 [Bradyrhizobium diazoefficiens]